MIPDYISIFFLPIGFCLIIVFSYFRGKKIENISNKLSAEDTKKLRKELMQKRDFSWLATIKLPKAFEYLGNVLALLIILFILTIIGIFFITNNAASGLGF